MYLQSIGLGKILNRGDPFLLFIKNCSQTDKSLVTFR